MKLKKWGIGLSILVFTFSVTACSGKTGTNTPAADQNSGASASNKSTDSGTANKETAKAQAPDPFGKYDPPIEVTAVRPITEGTKFAEGESVSNNVWSKAYEDMLGIKVKYTWTSPDAQYEQKSNITIATGDLPDIMQVNATQLKKLADDGQLADLSSVFDQYAAPFTKQVLSEDGGNALKSATFGGKLLALPQMGSGIGQTHVLWVRTDWLKKLNLPEPKTMNDVFTIADAFANKDPDGNNKTDTFGLGLNKDLFGFFAALEGFFNGYHAYPDIWMKDATGKLAYGSIQPEMKTALQKLHELYQAGLIDKEFGTKDAGKVKDAANAGKLGMFYGYFWNSGWLQDGKKTDPSMEWKPLPLPSIDNQPALAQVPFAINTYYVVKKNAKNPEAAIKMLNLALEKMYGKTAEPDKYSVDKNGTAIFAYVLLYGESPRKNLDASEHVIAALQSKDPSKLNTEEKGYYDNSVAYLGGDNNNWGNNLMYGPGGSLSVIDGYDKNKLLMNNQFFGAPTESMAQSNATLKKLELETFTSMIIRGSTDQFDQFVTKWKQLGGDKITEEVNAWSQTQK